MLENLTVEDLQENLQDYEVIDHIETGGQKKVFKASKDGQNVALKVVPVEERQRQERAERAIEAMETIESENLVNLIDYFTQNIEGTPVKIVIEEFIEGNTLRRRLEEGPLDPVEALGVFEKILRVISKFGNHRIVHRDIKPENIMFTEEGEPILLDVGIARFLEKDTITPSFLETGPGTHSYSAPEQLRNDKEQIDTRTDLFALGIVLYESLTSEHPFDIDEDTNIPDAILEDQKKELRGYLSNFQLEDEINPIFERLTKHHPHQRYRKAEFVLEDLGDINAV